MNTLAFRQLGYVTTPDRFDATLEAWRDVCSVGPFFVKTFQLADAVLNGEQLDASWLIGLSYLGAVQIEVIAASPDDVSPYQASVSSQHIPALGVLHHLAVGTLDFDGEQERLAALMPTIFTASMPGGRRVRYFYDDATSAHPFELIEMNTTAVESSNAMSAICEAWDGNGAFRRDFP